MKKNVSIWGAILLVVVVVILMGLLQSPTQHASADTALYENLIFTFVDSSDTNAAGDSVLTISGITASDEIRFALKWDKSGSPDTVRSIFPHTDSLTEGAGFVTPATFTYGDDYLIVWRDVNQ